MENLTDGDLEKSDGPNSDSDDDEEWNVMEFMVYSQITAYTIKS